MGRIRNAYDILVANPKRNRPFRKPRCREEDNTGVDLREVG
jgi:hypothetical protein